MDSSDGGCPSGHCGLGSDATDRCAAVVQKLGKSRGCNGVYFFYSTDGTCFCPTDDCAEKANVDTSNPGQLYEFSTQMEDLCAARRPEGLEHVVCNNCAVHVHRACDCIDNLANGIDCLGIDASVSVATLKVTDSALTTDLNEWMNKLEQDDQRYEQKDRFEKIEAKIEKARVESYIQGMQNRLDDLVDAQKKQYDQLQNSLDKVKVAITLRKTAMDKVHDVFSQLKSAFPDEANQEKSTLGNLRQELTSDVNQCAVVAKKHEIFGFLKAGINFGVGIFTSLLTQNYVGAAIAGAQGISDVLSAADKYKNQLDKLRDVKNKYGLDVQIPSPFDGTPCAGKLKDICPTALAWAHSHGLDSLSGNFTHLDINQENSWITKFLDDQEIHWLSKLSPEERDRVKTVYAKAEEVKKNLDKAADAVANILKVFTKGDKACKDIDQITKELDHHQKKLLVVKNQINALRSVYLAIQALDSVNFEDLINGPRPTSGLDQLDPQDAMVRHTCRQTTRHWLPHTLTLILPVVPARSTPATFYLSFKSSCGVYHTVSELIL